MKIIENCYCVGCRRYYAGPPGRFKDEINLVRCEKCEILAPRTNRGKRIQVTKKNPDGSKRTSIVNVW